MTVEGHGVEKYITGRMIDSSAGRNWKHLLAERWSHRAGELCSIVPHDTEIAVMLRGNTVVDRRGGGMRQRTHGRRGTIWLCPAGIHEEYVNVAETIEDCLHIYLPAHPFEEALLKNLEIDPSLMTLRYESINSDLFIEQIAGQILRELNAETSAGRLLIESLSGALSAHLVHRYSAADIRTRTSANIDKPLDVVRLARVMEFVDANIDGELTVSQMAGAACLSPAHFARSFKATTGLTPHQFVSERRLALAKTMLIEGRQSIAEIAYAAGFSSQANFARAFRRATRMTAGQFRAETVGSERISGWKQPR